MERVGVEPSGRIASLRDLSSQLFVCVMELVNGGACAGHLLEVLAGFLEALPGKTVGALPSALVEPW